MDQDYEQDKLANILRNGYCIGYHCEGRGIAQDPHTCPFGEEIRNDHSECNCCEKCEHQCAMDI